MARWWSTARFLRAAAVVLVLFWLVNGVVMAMNPGWRTHLLLGTSRTTVEVVAVDQDAVPCGRRQSGDRLEVVWEADGERQRGTLECLGGHEVGDRISAWPVAGERGYDWPAWQFYLFSGGVALGGGAGLTLLLGWSSARSERSGLSERGTG